MSFKYKLYASQVVDKFKLNKLINSDKLSDSKIQIPSIVRCDFELTGEIIYKDTWGIVYFGHKESIYLNKYGKDIVNTKIKRVLDTNPPLIILGPEFQYKNELIEIAKTTNIPVVESDMSLQNLNITVGVWLQEYLSEYTLYHGCLVNVFGFGVLITGESGIGKSEITIELIKKGHIFVADDSVLVTRIGSNVYGKPDNKTKNFIEIRGLGVLNFQKIFGIAQQIKRSKIDLVCELVSINDNKNSCNLIERLGSKINYTKIEDIEIPYYKILIVPGRKISDIIETAITDLKLKKKGYNPVEEISTQIQKENRRYK